MKLPLHKFTKFSINEDTRVSLIWDLVATGTVFLFWIWKTVRGSINPRNERINIGKILVNLKPMAKMAEMFPRWQVKIRNFFALIFWLILKDIIVQTMWTCYCNVWIFLRLNEFCAFKKLLFLTTRQAVFPVN